MGFLFFHIKSHHCPSQQIIASDLSFQLDYCCSPKSLESIEERENYTFVKVWQIIQLMYFYNSQQWVH